MNPPPGTNPSFQKMAMELLGWPSPEKVLAELQRFNHNIETLHPAIYLLAQAMQGLSADDIRNLAAALNGINAGDALKTLTDLTLLGNQIYERLWGPK